MLEDRRSLESKKSSLTLLHLLSAVVSIILLFFVFSIVPVQKFSATYFSLLFPFHFYMKHLALLRASLKLFLSALPLFRGLTIRFRDKLTDMR